jgi:hypothetical protein
VGIFSQLSFMDTPRKRSTMQQTQSLPSLDDVTPYDKTLYEIAAEKFQEVQHALQMLELEKDELIGKERDYVRQLQAWSIILETERPAGMSAGPSAPVQDREAQKDASSDVHGSRTNMVRTALMQAGIIGVTPKEISERMAKAGVHVSSSFANNALFRMKEKKEVFVAGGRYVLVQFAKQRAS